MTNPCAPFLLTVMLAAAAGCGGGDDGHHQPTLDAGLDANVADSGHAGPDLVGETARETAPAPVSFSRDVRPIFATGCIDCHYPDSATQYDLTRPFDPLVGIVGRANSWVPNGSRQSRVVDPGNVENSSLITKVSGAPLDVHVDGNPMPYEVPRLTASELDAIRQWITQGANDDAFFAATVAPIFGTQVTLRRESGKCTWCHYDGSPSGLSVMRVFDAAQGMVNRASRHGGKIVAPGDPQASVLMKKLTGTTAGPQMPLHRPRLTPGQVQVLRDWITTGAKND